MKQSLHNPRGGRLRASVERRERFLMSRALRKTLFITLRLANIHDVCNLLLSSHAILIFVASEYKDHRV